MHDITEVMRGRRETILPREIVPRSCPTLLVGFVCLFLKIAIVAGGLHV